MNNYSYQIIPTIEGLEKFPFFFFFSSTGVWTQVLTLSRSCTTGNTPYPVPIGLTNECQVLYWTFYRRHCFYKSMWKTIQLPSQRKLYSCKPYPLLMISSQVGILYNYYYYIITITISHSIAMQGNKQKWNLKSFMQKIPLLFSNSVNWICK
jgi:hypothetical protein